MSASKEAIKQLKVKTGTVTRCACAPIVLQRTAKGSAGGTAARALSLVQPKLVAAGKSRPDRTQRLISCLLRIARSLLALTVRVARGGSADA